MLLLASLTAEPPVGAAWVSVTVQAPAALCSRLEGLHASEEIGPGADRLTVAVFELLPRVAVTVAL